ncbi:MAG: hypothetical protein NW220_21955 [Leptolyngbyaceae cyanobacterium bins.349]|nr:hypothetical protein [Leptolyngbyaceae cyanobacterium bins.349]
MRYRVLEGGAIACSAVALWSLVAFPKPQSRQLCESSPPTTNSSSSSRKQDCGSQHRLFRASIMPEHWFHFNWGRDRPTPLPSDLETVYAQLLHQAQTMADRDRWADAIAQVSGIPKNSRHYALAAQLQTDWSQEILQQAMERYHQAQLKSALQLLTNIPASCQTYAQAQAFTRQWTQEAAWLHQAEVAWRSNRWYTVLTLLKKLERSPLYQSSPVQNMLQIATHKLYEPDPTLIELGSIGGQSTTVSTPPAALPRRPEFSQQTPLAVETLSPPAQLPIATRQALDWAQPPLPKAIAQRSLVEPTPPLPATPMSAAPALFPSTPPQTTATQSEMPPTRID